MKTELVHITKNKPFTDSIVIAEAVGLKHRRVIALIRKHQSDFKEFGTLNFQSSKSGGRETEFAEIAAESANHIDKGSK